MANVMNQSDTFLLLKEFMLRLKEKSPKFFRVLTNINYVIALIGAIPTVLDMLGIILPPDWLVVVMKIVAFGGAWGVLMTNLAVTKPTQEVLPFTEKKNIEKAIKENAAAEN